MTSRRLKSTLGEIETLGEAVDDVVSMDSILATVTAPRSMAIDQQFSLFLRMAQICE